MVLVFVILPAMIWPATMTGRNSSSDPQGVAVPFTEVSLQCKTMWFEPLVVNDRQAFEKAFEKQQSAGCEVDRKLKIDFQKYTFIALTKSADCQARVSVRVTKNIPEKVYVVTIDSEYGGCRGLTPHNRGLVVDKVPTDFSIRFENLKD